MADTLMMLRFILIGALFLTLVGRHGRWRWQAGRPHGWAPD